MSHWYLLRTKTGAERIAERQLANLVESTLVPLGKMQIRQGTRMVECVAPIFPCYLFAFFSLATSAHRVRYTPGVRDIVWFGDQAAVVPDWVIDHLTFRYGDGPVALSKPRLSHGAAVKLVGGPFGELDAIFDRYLSGAERVAVLMSVMNAERRVVVPANMVVVA